MKIVTADDHALIREGLKVILRSLDPLPDIVEATDGHSLRQTLRAHPDANLVLLDVHLPDCSGLALLPELIAEFPGVPVVLLSAEVDPEVIKKALELGASGFLPKTSLNQVLVSAVSLVMAGGVYVPPEAVRRQIPGVTHAVAGTVRPFGSAVPERVGLNLTERQWEVLWLLLEGKSNKQICRDLDLAEATVKVHVRAILRDLGVHTRAEAIVAAARLNLQRPLTGAAA
jgi:DNA-binding NarL/FixJ family response regulator